MSVLLEVVFKALKTERGDVVVLECEGPLTSDQFRRLRDEFSAAKKNGVLPDGVFFMVQDRPMDIRKMGELERRALLDELCSSLGMRAVEA